MFSLDTYVASLVSIPTQFLVEGCSHFPSCKPMTVGCKQRSGRTPHPPPPLGADCSCLGAFAFSVPPRAPRHPPPPRGGEFSQCRAPPPPPRSGGLYSLALVCYLALLPASLPLPCELCCCMLRWQPSTKSHRSSFPSLRTGQSLWLNGK